MYGSKSPQWLRDRRRTRAIARSFRRLRGARGGSPEAWQDLSASFGNPDYAARPVYLAAVAEAAAAARVAILECGSGLTTLVLGAYARETGSTVISLEHDPRCAEAVRADAASLRIEVDVRIARLRDYGSFDWYDIAPGDLPMFSLVVCDGPPGDTRGGRYGLLPVLRQRLDAPCTILLDDATRGGETEVLARWRSEFSVAIEVRGGTDPFAVVSLGGRGIARGHVRGRIFDSA